MKHIFKLFLSAILCAATCVCICACSCDDGTDSESGNSGSSSSYPIGDDVQGDIF